MHCLSDLLSFRYIITWWSRLQGEGRCVYGICVYERMTVCSTSPVTSIVTSFKAQFMMSKLVHGIHFGCCITFRRIWADSMGRLVFLLGCNWCYCCCCCGCFADDAADDISLIKVRIKVGSAVVYAFVKLNGQEINLICTQFGTPK